MRKIIAIGESVLDTVYSNNQPVRSFVGGRIANAAAILGTLGRPVAMVSECCADRVGDIIIDYLTRHHVDVNSIDRYTSGATSMSIIFNDGGKDTLVASTFAPCSMLSPKRDISRCISPQLVSAALHPNRNPCACSSLMAVTTASSVHTVCTQLPARARSCRRGRGRWQIAIRCSQV